MVHLPPQKTVAQPARQEQPAAAPAVVPPSVARTVLIVGAAVVAVALFAKSKIGRRIMRRELFGSDGGSAAAKTAAPKPAAPTPAATVPPASPGKPSAAATGSIEATGSSAAVE